MSDVSYVVAMGTLAESGYKSALTKCVNLLPQRQSLLFNVTLF